MAQKKRRTRSPSRSPKRSSSRSSSRSWSPLGLFLALAVIAGVGALTFWTNDQSKMVAAIRARFVESPTPYKPPSVKPEPETKQVAKAKVRQEDDRADNLPAPVPRPSIAVGPPQQNPVATKPVQQASLQPVQRPQFSVGPINRAVMEPPRGVNRPGMVPLVVYARDDLTLRRNASEGSAATGSVEKGREMRSYSKTGKWHHLSVPTTGIIGWVHEDKLIQGKHPANVSGMQTGAISSAPRPSQGQAAYPPRPVGKQ